MTVRIKPIKVYESLCYAERVPWTGSHVCLNKDGGPKRPSITSAQLETGQSESTSALRHSQSADDLLFSKTCRPWSCVSQVSLVNLKFLLLMEELNQTLDHCFPSVLVLGLVHVAGLIKKKSSFTPRWLLIIPSCHAWARLWLLASR